MNDAREKHIARVTALLAKTEENGATEAEALAALAMAQKLMSAWSIQPNEVRGVTGEYIKETLFDLPNGGYSTLKMYLAGVIAEANGCFIAYTATKSEVTGKKVKRIMIGGADDRIDIVRSQVLAAMAFAEVGASAAASTGERIEYLDYYGNVTKVASQRESSQAHKRGFWMGFTEALEEKLTEANEEVDVENDGSFLPALASDLLRAEAVFGRLRSSQASVKAGTSHGRQAGTEAARGYGTGSVAGSAPKALG